MLTVYVHMDGLDTALMEIEEFPKMSDTMLVGKNPRRRDGKDLPYMLPQVNTIIIPLTRISFIEIMPGEDQDDFETFIRE